MHRRICRSSEDQRIAFLEQELSRLATLREQIETYGSGSSIALRLDIAGRNSFRTWPALVAYEQHMRRTLGQLMSDPVFKDIWMRLGAFQTHHSVADDIAGSSAWAVPSRVVFAVEDWHRAAKFTAAERRSHEGKIVQACDHLINLLEQVSPGGIADKFGQFRLSPEQAERVFDSFCGASPSAPLLVAAMKMEQAGITPIWAIQKIRDAASFEVPDFLPTKVKTRTAFRTYIIREICFALSDWAPHRSLPIPDELIADAVCLLAGTDCSADDVRKAMAKERKKQAGEK